MGVKIKEKPNFRIIEGDYERIDYESFKKDYMNPFVSKAEILKKYDLTNNRYFRYGKRVFKDTGYKRKSGANSIGLFTHIRDCHNGKFRIDKQIDGRKLYCGTYKSFEVARKVRDYLVRNNWSDDAIKYCMECYGV